jgi:hypothetical protein
MGDPLQTLPPDILQVIQRRQQAAQQAPDFSQPQTPPPQQVPDLSQPAQLQGQMPPDPSGQAAFAQAAQESQQAPSNVTGTPSWTTDQYGRIIPRPFKSQLAGQTVAGTRGEHIKRGLSNALYALANAYQGGIGAGIMTALPGGQQSIIRGQQEVMEDAAAQRLAQTGQAVHGVYGSQAAQTTAGAQVLRSQAWAKIAEAKLPLELRSLAAHVNLADAQTGVALMEQKLKPLAEKFKEQHQLALEAMQNRHYTDLAKYYQGMLDTKQQANSILESWHNYSGALTEQGLGIQAQKAQIADDALTYRYGMDYRISDAFRDFFGIPAGRAKYQIGERAEERSAGAPLPPQPGLTPPQTPARTPARSPGRTPARGRVVHFNDLPK